MNGSRKGRALNSCFSRQLHDQKLDGVEAFLLRPQGKSIKDVEDMAAWMTSKSSNFSIKSYCSWLEHGMYRWVPTKGNFFADNVIWKGILTMDKSLRRRQTLVNICFMCKGKKEFVKHILIRCFKARIIWQLAFSLLGIIWVLNSLIKTILPSWHKSFVGKKQKKAWKVARLSLLQTIWKETNKRAFDNIELSNQKLKSLFMSNFLEWVKRGLEDVSMSMVDFVEWLGGK